MTVTSTAHRSDRSRRTRGVRKAAALATACVFVLAGCATHGSDSASGNTISVRLALLAVGYDCPVIYGDKLGYFKDQGLNVDIKESTGSSSVAQLVGNGQATIGFADLPTAAKAVVKGVPIKAVAAVFQKSPLATIYLKSSGIKSPQDLKGKQIGDEPNSASSQYQKAFLADNGMQASDVHNVNVDAAAREQLVAAGRLAAVDSYALEEVPQFDLKFKKPSAAFMWSDYGLNMLGLGIIASNKTIAGRPAMLRKFVSAYAKGYVASAKNPAACAGAIHDKFSDAGSGLTKVIEQQWALSQPLQHSTDTEGKPLLWMSSKTWASTLAVNAKYADSKTNKPVSDFYTNKFVPDVPKPAAPGNS